jgi:hypothetical protein
MKPVLSHHCLRHWLFVAMLILFALPTLPRAEDAPFYKETLSDQLFEPDKVEALLFLAGSRRISGESFEIPIPRLAEGFVPPESESQKDGDQEATSLKIIWRDGHRDYPATGIWQHRTRSEPASLKVTVPDIDLLVEPPFSMLLARRRMDSAGVRVVECHAFSGKYWSRIVLSHFGLTPDDLRPGVFGLDSNWNSKQPGWDAKALKQFLGKFDGVIRSGFTPTLRSGSTGIGYTLETLLDIKENNSPRGDFLGIELKSHRGDDFSRSSSKKMNLFLKEPVWLDGLSHKERIPKYGYVDDNGRTALYSTVTSKENSHGLKMTPEEKRIRLQFRGKDVAEWKHEILAGRLKENLTETIFVGAETRGSGRSEEFHFQTALYCREPSAERLAHLVATREAMVEMRMHIKETGSARNHGTAFRIRQNSLPQLYRMIVLCRTAHSAAAEE